MENRNFGALLGVVGGEYCTVKCLPWFLVNVIAMMRRSSSILLSLSFLLFSCIIQEARSLIPHAPKYRMDRRSLCMHVSSSSSSSGAAALAAVVVLNSMIAAPGLALPPMNCNSFGCYPVDVNPGGGRAVMGQELAPAQKPTAPLEAAGMEKPRLNAGQPPAIVDDSSPRALKLGRALRRNKGVMYGAYWCGFCNRERQELGKQAMSMVEYVECDPRGEGGDPDRCSDAGVSAFPTWVLSSTGARSEGARGLSGLERLVGLPSPPPPPNRPPQITSDSSPRALAVAKRLKDKGAVMYGAYWCGFCNRERQELGKQAMSMVEYVECDPRGEGGDPDRCSDAGVSAFPTWVQPVAGKDTTAKREGALGIEGLAKWMEL